MKEIKKLFIGILVLALVSPYFAWAEEEGVVPEAPKSPVQEETITPPVAPTLTEGPSVIQDPESVVPSQAEPAAPEQNLHAPFGTEELSPKQNSTSPTAGEKNTADTEVKNDAEVSNGVEANANTGENNASYNTGDAAISTGDANIVLSILNLINTNFITDKDGKIIFIYKDYFQDLTGDYVIDPVSGEAYDLTGSRVPNNLILNNNGTLNNNYNLTADTGGNSTSYNTGDGSIATGDANISLNVLNFLNSNFLASEGGLVAVVNVFGNWVGDLLIPDTLLPSGNSSGGVSNTSTTNNAAVQNNIEGTVNTGGNEASYNTGSGSISTGEALVNVAVSNILNQTIVGDVIYFTFVNVLGSWNGQDTLGITNTPGQSNGSNTTITNNALLNNTFHLFVNTGNNLASYNTGSGQITTGDAKAAVNLANFANVNIAGKKIVFLMVNVFGDWTGNIRKKEDVTTAEAPVISAAPSNVQIVRVPTRTAKKYFAMHATKGASGTNEELVNAEGVLAAEDFNFTLNDFPNLLKTEDLTPQVAAISDVIDFSYRYLFIASILTLIIFGIVYRRIRKGAM